MVSSASTQSSGGDVATVGSRCGSTPWVVPVLRKRLIEQDRRLEHNAPHVLVDVEDDGGEALGAGVETKIERHGVGV